MANTGATANMATKEKNLFNQMLQHYDNKMYKQGIKNAELILAKMPDHPESQAMKALLLNALKKKKEAFEWIKKALFKNFSNFTCWHVYGILQRSNKEYDGARKAYLNALKYDPNNLNVLRDLGQLQIQLRDYPGYVETRRQVLVQKPNVPQNWIMFAMASYLSKDYTQTLEILASLDKTLKEQKIKLKPYEMSELISFTAKVHEDNGNAKVALKTLLNFDKKILDNVDKQESLFRLYTKLGDKDKAIESLETLLRYNSANQNTYLKLIKAHGINLPSSIDQQLSADDQAKIKELMEKYAQVLPKVNTHIRVAMKYLQGDEFEQKLRIYAKPQVIKGVPSLLHELKELYGNPEKAAIIQKVLDGYCAQMQEDMRLDKDDEQEQDPTVEMWLMVYQAVHYFNMKQSEKALNWINKAIEHTPTVTELYSFKGKIYQQAGDRQRASQLHEQARVLDQADRYLSIISAKYFLKIDKVEESDATMLPFSRDGSDESKLNIHDMQGMWYEDATGNSYLRQDNLRLALKNFNHIERHFDQIVEDQYDFHMYSMRKWTLSAYINMIDFADNVIHNKYACRSAIGQIKVLNKIKKNQDQLKQDFKNQYFDYKESNEYRTLLEKLNKTEEEDDYRNDPDPEGYDLFQTCLEDPDARALEVATKVVAKNPESAELHAKCIPVFLRKGKLMLALKSATILKDKHADHPKTLPALRKFFGLWRSLNDDQKQSDFKDDAKMIKLVEMELTRIGCPKDTKGVEAMALDKKNATSLKHLNEWSKVMQSEKKLDLKQFEKNAVQAATEKESVYDLERVHKNLVKFGSKGDDLKAKCLSLFPKSSYFAQ